VASQLPPVDGPGLMVTQSRKRSHGGSAVALADQGGRGAGTEWQLASKNLAGFLGPRRSFSAITYGWSGSWDGAQVGLGADG
jgi:hypothetical protein